MNESLQILLLQMGLAALFSAVLASFFATVTARAVAGAPWRECIGGRSRCNGCGRTIPAWDLIPVLSFLLLRGRCRFCAAPLTATIFWAEAVSFFLAAIGTIWLQGEAIAAGAVLVAALATLAACDWQSGYLPDILTLPLLLGGLFFSFMEAGPLPQDALIGVIGGYASFRLVALAYKKLRGREGLGGGDARLLAAAGAWLGWQWLAAVVLLSAVVTLVGALLWHILTRRRLSATAELPFGPGLGAAIWLCWLLARGMG